MGNANRGFSRDMMALEKDVVNLYATITIGSSGAVSSSQGGGLVSVTKESTAGQYTVVMDKGYSRLLHISASLVGSSAAGVANVQVLLSPSALQTAVNGTGAIVIQCYDYAGSAVNAASGSQIMLHMQYRRTSVSPWD